MPAAGTREAGISCQPQGKHNPSAVSGLVVVTVLLTSSSSRPGRGFSLLPLF